MSTVIKICKILSSLLLLVIVATLVPTYGQEPDGQQPNNGHRAGSSIRRTGGLDPDLHRAYVNAYEDESDQPTTAAPSLWERLTPRLPSPSEVDCYVDVIRTRRRGGRCTRLGGYLSQPYICQSGPHFEFSHVCQQIMANRTAQQQQDIGQP